MITEKEILKKLIKAIQEAYDEGLRQEYPEDLTVELIITGLIMNGISEQEARALVELALVDEYYKKIKKEIWG